MSKMQMLLFAVGIAVVALMFYSFVSNIGLSTSASNLLVSDSKAVSDQINNDLLCSDKLVRLPDSLTYGFNNQRFFYDLEVSKQSVGSGDSALQNLLIFRIVEHKNSNYIAGTQTVSTANNSTSKKNIIGSTQVASDAEFVLIDPGFIAETSSLKDSYNGGNVEQISLNPRGASLTSQTIASPDGFFVVKEVKNDKKTVYIIPCSSNKEPNNCVRNVLRLGCYLLSISPTPPTADSLVPSCLNKSSEVSSSVQNTRNYTWGDCRVLFPEILS